MYKMFTLRNNSKWIDILQNLIDDYNNSYHRTIEMKPNEVNALNERLVLKNIIKNTRRHVLRKITPLKVGDKVRISKYKSMFDKGYKANWTNEVFTIGEVFASRPVTYSLVDYKNKILKGRFYHEELQKTKHGDVYLVDKILSRRGDQVKVRWQGFDGTHDTWINRRELV